MQLAEDINYSTNSTPSLFTKYAISCITVEILIGGLPTEDDAESAKSCHVAVDASLRLSHLF